MCIQFFNVFVVENGPSHSPVKFLSSSLATGLDFSYPRGRACSYPSQAANASTNQKENRAMQRIPKQLRHATIWAEI